MIKDRRPMTEDRRSKNSFFILFYLLTSIFYLLGFSGSAYADKVYLKDGKNYEGKLIGKSERRFLFSMNVGGETFQMSFFPEDVEKIELDKDTVEAQIPYLKEVESLKVKVDEGKTKTYQLSLYKESQSNIGNAPTFSEKELKSTLNKEEGEYYTKFNDILKRYVDKLQVVQNIYMNLTTATRDDFAQAKQYMDELYFELNNIIVPEAFKKSHTSYLESLKAGFLAFRALEQGMLDEASAQIKVSEESKQRSMSEFRQVIVARNPTQQ
jgi:hypothetical protein